MIAGEDVPAFFNEHSRVLLRHCGALIRRSADNQVEAKGTATFVRHGDEYLILTANHVIEGLGAEAVLMLPPVSVDGSARVGVPSPPTEVELGVDVVWRSEAFDVAFVRAPAFDYELVDWFDLDHSVEVARRLKSLWAVFNTEDGSLPYAVSGYPNYGHLRFEDEKLEMLSALPLFAYVDDWTDGPGAVPLTSRNVSQIKAEAVAEPRDSEELAALPEVERHMASRLKSAEVDNPFGGYSGGPLVLFDQSGVHLVGTIKEGGWLFATKAQFFISPIDQVVDAAEL